MKQWHALEALNEGVEKTGDFLFKPFNLRLWLRLALIVFIINTLSGIVSQGTRVTEFGDSDPMTGTQITLVLAVLAVMLIIVLFLQFVSSVFKFILMEGLFEDKVEFGRGFRRNAKKGLSLFLFNFLIGIMVVIISVVLVLAGVFLGARVDSIAFWITLIILGILFLALLIVAGTFFSTLTEYLIVPLMHFGGYGVIKSWKSLIRLAESNLKQFIVYMLLTTVLGIAAAILEFAITIPLILSLIVILIIVGGGCVLAWLGLAAVIPVIKSITLLAVIAGAIILILIIVALSYLTTALTLPIPVFFRYYSVFFLRKLEPILAGKAGPQDKATPEKPPEESTIKEGAGRTGKKPASKPRIKDKNTEKEIKAY